MYVVKLDKYYCHRMFLLMCGGFLVQSARAVALLTGVLGINHSAQSNFLALLHLNKLYWSISILKQDQSQVVSTYVVIYT